MKKLVLGSILSVLLSSGLTFAGGASSGGGGAYVCKDANGNITSAHLLDLWEATNIRGLNIPLTFEPRLLQIERALTKLATLDPEIAAETRKQIGPIFQNAHSLSGDVLLAPPSDADSNYEMAGCPLTGMMFYDGDQDQLQIVPPVFNALATETDVAAAMVHEALYYAIRETQFDSITNSTPVRKLVACLFSDSPNCAVKESIETVLAASDQVYQCENQQVSFYLLHRNDVPKKIGTSETPNLNIQGWMVMLSRLHQRSYKVPVYNYIGVSTTGTASELSNYDIDLNDGSDFSQPLAGDSLVFDTSYVAGQPLKINSIQDDPFNSYQNKPVYMLDPVSCKPIK
jgi:hypothetical protein